MLATRIAKHEGLFEADSAHMRALALAAHAVPCAPYVKLGLGRFLRVFYAPPRPMSQHGCYGKYSTTTSNRTPLTADARPEWGSWMAEPRGVLLYSDKNLTCADCGQQFVFTASEQDFYAQRGFTEPRRCPSCRASRKAARNAEGGGSSSYGGYGAGGGYSAGGGGGYGGGGGGYRDRGPREMFEATCSSCGKEAQVPFRPTSGKPVYCSDCFRSQRGG